MNAGVRWPGPIVAVMVDGARMLSPGMLRGMLQAFQVYPDAFVSTLGWHLGEQPQNLSMVWARTSRWKISCWRRSTGPRWLSAFQPCLSGAVCQEGWFSSIAESNCYALPKRWFQRLGGFDCRFVSPGGGLVNLDFFSLAVAAKGLTAVLLLGEGSFHQFHGGVATNVPKAEHPWERFHAEYQAIRGKPYARPAFDPVYFGRLSAQARRFLPGL